MLGGGGAGVGPVCCLPLHAVYLPQGTSPPEVSAGGRGGAGPPAPAQEAPNCPVLIACFSPAAGWGLPWAWSLLLEGN